MKARESWSNLTSTLSSRSLHSTKSTPSLTRSIQPVQSIGTLNLKLAVVGPENSGKSQIIKRYVEGTFDVDYDATIEDQYSKCGFFDVQRIIPSDSPDGRHDVICRLDIADTSGNIAINMIDEHIANADGFMFVYDRGDLESAVALINLYYRVVDVRGSDVPIVVVENKSDVGTLLVTLDSTSDPRSHIEKPHIRASAKMRENIDEAFEALVCEIVHHRYVVPFEKLGITDDARKNKRTSVQQQKIDRRRVTVRG
ncbi:Ras GTPase [Acrasis kona]|uniref:Ras GTPase n=1 Tax=Acrasis kona TaxID=1008807 RepID=A0AAW2YMV0_9EUKA